MQHTIGHAHSIPGSRSVSVISRPAGGGTELLVESSHEPGPEEAFALLSAGALILRDVVNADGSLKGVAMAILDEVSATLNGVDNVN